MSDLHFSAIDQDKSRAAPQGTLPFGTALSLFFYLYDIPYA
ncbi:hypothetical protein HMPREF1555_00897 [Porphyromonas gingivalis F0570]|uniref:Uncharacterized protein n=1 Tax=Porphyromonas gingivalis F0570 TaxID=1227271 RepID=A0A0E2LRK1_PORGN|nr:hypothetical protein HMPREF1555_00897 [Porphyromonas gingivalis F0570]